MAKAPTQDTPVIKAPIVLVPHCDLLEAFTMQRFFKGIPAEVPEITNYLQAQIDAGLMHIQGE